MRKVLRIAWTEYLNAVRSKAFILGVLLLPVLIGLSILFVGVARKRGDVTPKRFAVVDRSGTLFAVIAEKAARRNAALTNAAEARAPFEPESVAVGTPERDLELSLSDRIRRKELFAFVILGADLGAAGRSGDRTFAYHTQTPTHQDLPDWLDEVVNAELRQRRFAAAGLDPAMIADLSRTMPLGRLGLATRDEFGAVVQARQENRAATFLVPMGAMFLLFMIVMSSAPALLNTVLEEKMQKIAEVLLAAVTPFQLMLGKLLGAVLVSLTLAALYLGSLGRVLVHFGVAYAVPWSLYGWFFLFLLLALFIFGAVFGAVGAACNEIRDTQNLMLPVMLMIMLPLMAWMPVLQAPNGPLARMLSLIPPFTPLLMLLRLAVPPGPAWWEVALGVVLTTLFMLGCVWAAGKIFRVGLLAQGQTPSLRGLARWVLSK